MHVSVRSLTIALALLTVLPLALALPTPATAQQPDSAPFTIKFDMSLTFLPDLGGIHAFVGVTECGSLDPTQEDWTLVVGGPGTPAACNQPWRVVNLILDQNGLLADDPVFMPGETITFYNLKLYAYFDSLPEVPFVIQGRPDDDSITAADLAVLGSLTAYVDGVACGSTSAEDLQNGILYLPVGDSGTPEVCRQPGAEIILVNGSGHRLVVRPSVSTGRFYYLTNLAPEPPGPGAPGSAGLSPTSTASHTIELLLATVALTILARRLTAKR